ncbi:hypothetical protein [Nocardioides bigeumensis]|uniref:Uncharacterized protein n=1 Tax=Nocardioides bigeumensis TaxID=433657 RepID=A0ABN2YJV1_9ACTN
MPTLTPPTPQTSRPIKRRAAIQAGLWSAPAIVVSAAAPAAAATSGRTLTLDGGASNPVLEVGLLTWEFWFASATIVNDGPPIPANSLQLTATFAPDPGFGGHSLLALQPTAPPGWTKVGNSNIDFSVTYVYAGSVASGATVPIPDGYWFGTWEARDRQQGSFVLTARTISGSVSPPWTLHVPPSRWLQIGRGGSAVVPVGPCAGLQFDNFAVSSGGGTPPDLRLTTTFLSDPDATDPRLSCTSIPTGWSGSVMSNADRIDWTATTISGATSVPDGTYFWTTQSALSQPGFFQVLATSTGNTSSVWRVHT